MATIVTIGEALVEMMRTRRDVPLGEPGEWAGPFPSGAPAIAASAAARLGASVAFIGTVGADAFGDCLIRRLMADGIDCSGLRRLEGYLTGIAFVAYRSDGSRQFIFHLPHSAAAQVEAAQIPPHILEGARYAHIMGSSLSVSEAMREACYALAREVHARGGVVSLDPNLRPELLSVERIREVCQPILDIATIVFPSGEELATLSGEREPEAGAQALLRRGVRIVALKKGERGSTLFTQEGTIDVPPYRVTEVDPTGAGDCFDAAFLVGLAEGWSLERAGRFANAVGALATTRLGPMEGTFRREEVLAFMAEQGRPFE